MALGKGIVSDTTMLGLNQVEKFQTLSKSIGTTPVKAITPAERRLDIICELRIFSVQSDLLVSYAPDAPGDEWVTWPSERILILPLNTGDPEVYIRSVTGTSSVQIMAFGFTQRQ